jgi:hypothetical protein
MLWRSERGFVFSGDYLQFTMDDQKTAGGVPCRVSRTALDVFADKSGLRISEELPIRFKTFRTEIEKIASDKYDRGERGPDGTILIEAADVSPA